MVTGIVDVLVHIDETLSAEELARVVEAVRKLNGVAEARAAEGAPHLILVEYDPEAVRPKDILSCVTGQGLHAELIGL